MTTPQLSPKLEKRLEKIPLLDTKVTNDAWNSWKFVPSKELKDFLATAIEEERQKVLELLVDEKLPDYQEWAIKTGDYGGSMEEYESLDDIVNHQNQLRAELRQQIKEMK